MNYITFNEQFDKTNPESIIDGIKSYISDDALFNEQKLFGIKLLLEDNSISYISHLKSKIEKLKSEKEDNAEYEKLKEENTQLKSKLAEAGQTIHKIDIINSEYKKMLFPAKKKVVIKKK